MSVAGAGYIGGLVSVVIPAHNAQWCVEKAIDSALNQGYPSCEVIVVNDGSTDGTASILARYRKRIRVIEQENTGLSRARNAGIGQALGEFVAFLDADDHWAPTKLERQVALLQAQPNIGFCSTETIAADEHGREVNRWCCPVMSQSVLHTIFAQNAAVAGSGSSVLVRREVLDRVGLFDPALRSLEDIDMWMRMAAVTDYACINEPLTYILKRRGSMSGDLDVMRASALRVMKKNRVLLDASSRGAFWRFAYAGVLADYAKWECRVGRKGTAMLHLLQALWLSPLGRGRLVLGLLVGVMTGALAEQR